MQMQFIFQLTDREGESVCSESFRVHIKFYLKYTSEKMVEPVQKKASWKM